MVAQCKYCGKKGLFLRVNNIGLCDRCNGPVMMSIQSIVRVIDESIDLIETSKNFKTRLSRIDVTIKNHQTLYTEYWCRGIQIFNKNPLLAINELNHKRKLIIEDEIYNLVEKHLDKAKRAATLNTKLSNGHKALDELLKFKQEFDYEDKVLESKIHVFLHKTQYDELVLKAEKEEFKGNSKKAIDQYQEALFFLKNDGIPDNEQAELIAELESRISRLQANRNPQK